MKQKLIQVDEAAMEQTILLCQKEQEQYIQKKLHLFATADSSLYVARFSLLYDPIYYRTIDFDTADNAGCSQCSDLHCYLLFHTGYFCTL